MAEHGQIGNPIRCTTGTDMKHVSRFGIRNYSLFRLPGWGDGPVLINDVSSIYSTSEITSLIFQEII